MPTAYSAVPHARKGMKNERLIMFEQKKYGPLVLHGVKVSGYRGSSKDGERVWRVESYADGLGYSTHWIANGEISRVLNSGSFTPDFEGVVPEIRSDSDLAPQVRQAVFQAIEVWDNEAVSS
jgi:hypothetical protein